MGNDMFREELRRRAAENPGSMHFGPLDISDKDVAALETALRGKENLSRAAAALPARVRAQPGQEYRLPTGRARGRVRLCACAAVSELVRRDLVDIAWTYENGDLGLRGRR